MDCDNGTERSRAVQEVDLQMNPHSSEGKTGETELEWRLCGSGESLDKSRTWL